MEISKTIAISFIAFAMLPCAADVRTWCGPSGEQDWNAATNWVDEAVPTGADTAYFPHNAADNPNGTGRRRYCFKVAPPADFTGMVLTTNEFWSVDGQSLSYLNRSFRTRLELVVSDGASWTVSGNGCVFSGQ